MIFLRKFIAMGRPQCTAGAEAPRSFSRFLETAVLWRLQLHLKFGRKIVADFSTQKKRKSWGENRLDSKSGPETYSSAAPNRCHLHAVQPVFRHYTSTALGKTYL
jgi:hypothetical protein